MTTSQNSTLSPVKIWWLAIRPRTLPAAISGVLVGTALAVHDHVFRFPQFVAALFIALLLQIGSNLANDVFDFERGADTGTRQGPQRVTQSGLLAPAQVKRGMMLVFALAGLLGLFLAITVSWWVIPVGMAAILAAVAYTAGPFPLGYHGLGELFVLLFFGFASVVGTYSIQAGAPSPAAWWMSLPIGLIIVGILVVNNYRDLADDRLAGKHTLSALFGARFSRIEYSVCILLPYLLIVLYAALGIVSWSTLLTWLSLPSAILTVRMVYTQVGMRLNRVLANTGKLALIFSLLFLLPALLQTL
jgi:1,4-dihydroxy-2-naphthoate octaprenyltransferase